MAALQFIRHMNAHKDLMVVHGVNLSLSIPHDVANYACGRTPVCDECERLVAPRRRRRDGGRQPRLQQAARTPTAAPSATTATSASPTRATPRRSSRSDRRTARCRTTTASATSPAAVRPATGERSRTWSRRANTSTPARSTAMRDDGRHQHGRAARQRRGGAADGPPSRADRPPARIKEILCNTATDLGREPRFQGARHGRRSARPAIGVRHVLRATCCGLTCSTCPVLRATSSRALVARVSLCAVASGADDHKVYRRAQQLRKPEAVPVPRI